MSATLQLNESMVRDIVEQVLGQLGKSTSAATPAPSAPAVVAREAKGFGVFANPADACAAAHDAYEQLSKHGMEGRRKVVRLIKDMARANAEPWGKMELDETKIGRLDHKIEKLQIIGLVPGVEDIVPEGRSGDHGITMEEYCPFGVIAAVTPATHSIPTLSGNVVNIVAAGNSVVFNTHPSATRCAVHAVREYNKVIHRELGIENLICVMEAPTLDTFTGICTAEQTKLLCVTGGPGVVAAAMKTGKRAICGGPGNPPVVVANDVCPDRVAAAIIKGSSYDNNLLCIGEKEVFVVEAMWDRLMAAMERAGAVKLDARQIESLTKSAFTFDEAKGGGCARAHVHKDFVGKDVAVLARAAGVSAPGKAPLLFGETDRKHPFVVEEQMMPFLPFVRVKDVNEGIEASLEAEHGYRHTAIIHTHNVDHMTRMARAMNTTLFVKNGACTAALGLGGEGFLSYTIATPTGEGVTRPKTFTRVRRCVMVDNLRIY